MSARAPSSRLVKKVLLSLLAVGAASALGVSGTFAIMTSEETNLSSTASAGTFTLGNQVNGGTACYSYGSGSSDNANPGCSALFTSSTLEYPGSSATSTLTIANNGSIGVGDLVLYMPSCTAQTSPGAGAQAGGGNPCSYVTDSGGNPDGPQLSLQEWQPTTTLTGSITSSQTTITVASDAGFPGSGSYPILVDSEVMTVTGGQGTTTWTVTRGADGTTAAAHNSGASVLDASYCWYPNPGSGACGPYTDDTLSIFGTYLNTLQSPLDLKAGPAAGASRTFTVTVQLPTNTDQTLQGEEASFALTWHASP